VTLWTDASGENWGGGLGGGEGQHKRISPPLLTQPENIAHHLKGSAGSYLFIYRRRKTVPLPPKVFAENQLNREKGRREERVRKGKA